MPVPGVSAGANPGVDASASAVAGVNARKDPVLPRYGTTKIDVRHYALDLTWAPATKRLTGTAKLTIKARQALTSFPLSLHGMSVKGVTTAGQKATFTRSGDRLTIKPHQRITKGTVFTTQISYSGKPKYLFGAEGTSEGWLPTPGGAVALGEPVGSMTWFPLNNTPRDKATYLIAVTVPERLTAVSNGRLISNTTSPTGRTWRWKMNKPMAGYLATVAVGDYRRTTMTKQGIRYDSFVAKAASPNKKALKLLPKVIAQQQKWFGPHPFRDAGILVDLPRVRYALETQTRSFFPMFADEMTLVHEVAHQWYGNSVTPATWRDIWLNEGFATYAEWLWTAKHGGPTPAKQLRKHYKTVAWRPAPRGITITTLFSDPVYIRGAMTLQVIRERIGRPAFFKVLRAWAKQNQYGTVSTRDFKALVERISGKQVDDIFRDWLNTPKRPSAKYVK